MNLPTEQQQQIITAALKDVTCSSDPTAISRAVATALAALLNSLSTSAVTNLCKSVPTNPLCEAVTKPGGIDRRRR